MRSVSVRESIFALLYIFCSLFILLVQMNTTRSCLVLFCIFGLLLFFIYFFFFFLCFFFFFLCNLLSPMKMTCYLSVKCNRQHCNKLSERYTEVEFN